MSKVKKDSGKNDGEKKKPKEPVDISEDKDIKKAGSGPAQMMGLIRAKNWVTRKSGAFALARAKAS